MLKIFKHYTSKTSLLDDFMYYENRQKLLQQEKARLQIKNYKNPFMLPCIEPPPRKLNAVLKLPINDDAKPEQNNNESNLEVSISTDQVLVDKEVTTEDYDTSAAANKVEEESGILKFGSLDINPKKAGKIPVDGGGSAAGNAPAPATDSLTVTPGDVVTVGSMPLKVNVFANSVGSLTVGLIPLDARALNVNKVGLSANSGSRKG